MLKRTIGTTFAILVILFMIGASGLYNVGADAPHWPVTRKIIEIVRDRAIEVRAARIQVPDLSKPEDILQGAGQYSAMCANCHLSPGETESEIRPGLYPQPPNLSEKKIDPKRAFWVIKHGLKMSGMPAWGYGHDDRTLWTIVAFVQKLPEMSAQRYKQLVAKAPPDKEMESMGNMDNSGQKRGRGMNGISASPQ